MTKHVSTESAQELQEQQRAPLAIPDATREFAAYLAAKEEFLSTPFISPTQLASSGARFTIHRSGRRTMQDPISEDDVIERIMYIVVLEDQVSYMKKDQTTEANFAPGSAAIIAQNVNPLREDDLEMISSLLTKFDNVPHVSMKFVPLSSKGRARGWNPAITFVVEQPA